MLGFADVQLDVLGLAGLADDHAGIYLGARLDEEGAAVLGVEEAVGDSRSGFKGDQASL